MPGEMFWESGANLGFEYNLKNPLDSLIEGVLISIHETLDGMFQ